MRKNIMFGILFAILTITATTGALYAITYTGVKCASCKGTGWVGQYRCAICGGDGIFGN